MERADVVLHCQLGVPHWAERFYKESGATFGKVMDPGVDPPLPQCPEVRWIVRFYEEEAIAKEEVLNGSTGAWQRFKRVEPELRKRPWLSEPRFWVTSMNEPTNAGLLQFPETRMLLDEHEAAFVQIMWKELGIRVCAYNLGVGHPQIDPVHIRQLFSKGFPALLERFGLWAMHAYGYPNMQHECEWYSLRYRKIIDTMRAMGWYDHVIPYLFVGECGIDKLIIGHIGGWQTVNNNPDWVVNDQIRWFINELRKDPVVVAASWFTETPAPEWITYQLGEDAGMRLAGLLKNS